LLIDSGYKTKQQVLSDLAISASDLESLACLPEGYFGSEAEVQMPRLKNLETPRNNDNSVVQIEQFRLKR
jgi:hypothetical protein